VLNLDSLNLDSRKHIDDNRLVRKYIEILLVLMSKISISL
jgi:hypothetical protein